MLDRIVIEMKSRQQHSNSGLRAKVIRAKFVYLRDSFDVLYDEGRTCAKMMNVGMHMRLLGHPGRAAGLIRFLDYVLTKPDVWVCRRIEIARHWLQRLGLAGLAHRFPDALSLGQRLYRRPPARYLARVRRAFERAR